MNRHLSHVVAVCVSLVIGQWAAAQEPPRPLDDRLSFDLVADSDQIVTPTGIAVDAADRVYVIENHTHHRPRDYQGPLTDRIKIFTPGPDDKLKLTGVFHEGFTDGMQLAFGPDGSLYLVQRARISRLRDTDADGRADKVELIVDCQTTGEYPHNGMSGIAFDAQGNFYFGIGENFGHAYTMVGADGSKVSGNKGEGGSYFFARGDGSKLRRVATGIWNPFGLCVDRHGRVFATDNDPGSSPPCRLIHVVDGGDYGYRHHYGGGGTSPLITWTGGFVGTLPMANAVGEGACSIFPYELANLPTDYRGKMFVSAWSDHVLETHELIERGASFASRRITVVQGGVEFRPVGIAASRDGSLLVSDWVSASYPVHGRGRIWRLSAKRPATSAPTDQATQPASAAVQQAKALRAMRLPQDRAALLAALEHADAFIVNAAVTGLSRSQGIEAMHTAGLSPVQRAGVLVAMQRANPAAPAATLRRFLADADRDVRFYALRWISDERRTDMRSDIEQLLARSDLDARSFIGGLQALDRMDDKPPAKTPPPQVLQQHLASASTPPTIQALCLKLMPATYAKPAAAELATLSESPDAAVRLEAIRLLGRRGDSASLAVLARLAAEEKRPTAERAEAVLGLAPAAEAHAPLLDRLADGGDAALRGEAQRALVGVTGRTSGRRLAALPPTDAAAWARLLAAGKGDVDAGRRIFFGAKVGTCGRCHTVDGRGTRVGPDLTNIGQRDNAFLLASLLDPSAEIAPQYIARLVTTHDGKQVVGIPLRLASTETFLTLDGRETGIRIEDIKGRQDLTTSLMPPGLLSALTEAEARDLLAFLASLK